MKKLFLLITLYLYATTLFSQQSRVADISTRDFMRRSFVRNYVIAPSLMELWNNDSYSIISLSYDMEKGDYRDFQKHNKYSQLNLNTESVVSKIEGGWSFYGKFNYKNGSAKNSSINLNYHLPENGSPYYYFMEQPGDWNLQNYLINGAFSKVVVKDKIFAGAALRYESDLCFRTVDTRNESYNLIIDVTPSVTLKTFANHFFTLGFNYKYDKTTPDFSNKYQHSGAGTLYNIYINQGLGTYIKDAPWSTLKVADEPSAIAAWSYVGQRYTLMFDYKYSYSNEQWSNKMTSSISALGENLGMYKNMNNKLNISLFSNLNCGVVALYASGEMLSGIGSNYNQSVKIYEDNYTIMRNKMSVAVELLTKKSIIKRVEFNFAALNSSEADLTYGQTITYSNIVAGAAVDFSKQFGKSELLLSLRGSYKQNIYLDHQKKAAAQNLVTNLIVDPKLSFVSSNNYSAGALVGWSLPIFKQYIGELKIGADYVKPTQINGSYSQKYINIDTNYFFINSQIVFNF